jgi:hypothetical protein
MKKYIAFFLLLGMMSSCTKNEADAPKSALTGTWKLSHVLADPGDGSGTFTPVDSEKLLSFSDNGNFTSNGSVCDMSVELNANTNGTYSEDNSTLHPIDCPDAGLKFEVNNNTLNLIYPCIEPCIAKYTKIQ